MFALNEQGMQVALMGHDVSLHHGSSNKMYNRPARIQFLKGLLFTLTLICGIVLPAKAQDQLTPPKVEAKATFGGAAFDETSHGVAGGSVRFYFYKRLSVEPEFLYMYHQDTDKDYVFQPNLAFDLTDPKGRFVPY